MCGGGWKLPLLGGAEGSAGVEAGTHQAPPATAGDFMQSRGGTWMGTGRVDLLVGRGHDGSKQVLGCVAVHEHSRVVPCQVYLSGSSAWCVSLVPGPHVMARPRKRAGEVDLGCTVMGFWAARECSGAALASDPLLMLGGEKHLEVPKQEDWQGLPGSGVWHGAGIV